MLSQLQAKESNTFQQSMSITHKIKIILLYQKLKKIKYFQDRGKTYIPLSAIPKKINNTSNELLIQLKN